MSYVLEAATLGVNVDVTKNSFDALNELRVPPKDLMRPWPWRVLIAPLFPDRKTKGGILLTDDTADAQNYLVPMGRLLDIGPQAFVGKRLRGDKEIDWVPEIGAWVMFGRYAGIRFYHSKEKLALIVCNDDDILGPIHDPRDWKVLV